MKILVTGGDGFVGRHLLPALEKCGHDVINLDIKSGVDIAKWDEVSQIGYFNVVIHLAALSFVPDSYIKPMEFYHININSTLNMLELCRINNAKMIFASSYVYGKPQYIPIDESHPINSFNPYCHSKIMCEQLCESYAAHFGVKSIIFRPFNLYGPGQSDKFLIPTIIEQMKNKKEVILKDPRPRRDLLHVFDAVRAYTLAVDFNPPGCDIFNLGYGKSYSVKQIVEMILSNSRDKFTVNWENSARQNEVLDTCANSQKAKDNLNWMPLTGLREGIIGLLKTYGLA